LREILGLLKGQDGLSVPEVNKLPNTLGTLKSHVLQQLPLLNMRTKAIPLLEAKLPTLPAGQKNLKNPPRGMITKDLHFFDPQHLFQSIMSCDIGKKIHQGFGFWVDSETEAWHSYAWKSSCRSTSGQYAHYPNGKPIFPSDFITYRDSEDNESVSLGRVCAVGLNFRSDAPVEGQLTLMVQRCFISGDDLEESIGVLDPPMTQWEVLLCWDMIDYIPESLVSDQQDVDLAYEWGIHGHVVPLEMQVDENGQEIPKVLPLNYEGYYTRRILENVDNPTITWLSQSHPIRGELELNVWGREHFEAWDVKNTTTKCISLPLQVFIDGFGVYRNSYRSLMGFYAILAGFTVREKNRRANVFPLTLGPHGSHLDDVIRALSSLRPLDKGISTTINGEETIFCVFTLNFLTDLVGGNSAANIKGMKAKKSCRFCLASTTERADLSYNIVANGRFHHQTIAMRRHMQDLPSKSARDEYSSKWGLDETPALATISPAMDFITSFPPDPAHSEYQGLSQLMHEMLKDTILTAKALDEYNHILRSHPFPPGWARLQSPIRHLGSYSLSDHARWSIIIPGLLRKWLQKSHIKPAFWAVARDLWENPTGFIVGSYAAVAKSNSLLMGTSISATDRADFNAIVLQGRQRYQDLCKCASRYVKKVREEQGLATPVMGSRAGTPVGFAKPTKSRTNMAEESQELKEKQQQHLNNTHRPNVHVGLHYTEMMDQYGLPSLCNVLIGEDKHR
jgi:hypothetical protein